MTEPAAPESDVPTFSIIVPAYNVRAYLRACLDSILSQSFGDFEVIAIDDASPDGSGEILDEYADDERVRVLHLAENGGLGLARNAGLEVARGRYVLFVDADDSLVGGALHAIVERLRETGEPDILMFDYARTYWWGQVSRNVMADALTQTGPEVFTIADRPRLLHVLMVVWNKAYRRDWLVDQGLRFWPGYYEDLPWTYPAMISAKRVAVLDLVCYHYRQRRHGNILRSQGRQHLEVFEQYARVFAFLDAHPELESWREFLFGRMVSHIFVIMRTKNRLRDSDRRDLFRHLVEAYERFRPDGYTAPRGRGGVKLQAVARGNYAAFVTIHEGGTALRAVQHYLAMARRFVRRQLGRARRGVARGYYLTQLVRPLDENLAVYAAYWGEAYSCNPRAIYEQARQQVPHVRGVWMVTKDKVDVVPAWVPYVVFGSSRYFRTMARAKYLVNNVNFEDCIVKRRGSIHLQTNHGTPLKKMGLELREFPIGANGMRFRDLLHRCDRWDYLLSSNRYSSEVWERAYPCPYVTLETGYPRNDRLVRVDDDETARMREQLGIPAGKTVVLYAPTFRDWSRTQFTAAVPLEELCRRLGKQYLVMVRGHYFTGGNERLRQLEKSGMLRDVSDYPVVEDLMIASDLLLTDYSSIMFDYANLDRPIVIYAADWEQYRRARGTSFDLMAFPPGAVAVTLDQLSDTLLRGGYRGDVAEHARAEFRKRFCQFDDGEAAERVVRQVFVEAGGAPAAAPVEHPVDHSKAPAQ